MAKLKPVVAKDFKSLEMYISNSNNFIIIADNKLKSYIKNEVKSYSRNKSTIGILKGIGVATGGILLSTIASPITMVAGAITFFGGLISSANILTKEVFKRLNLRLREYVWAEFKINEKTILILTKIKGYNKVSDFEEFDKEEINRLISEI